MVKGLIESVLRLRKTRKTAIVFAEPTIGTGFAEKEKT
jgi:hypothetical protein